MKESSEVPATGEVWNQFDLGEVTKVGSVLAAVAYATGVIAINTYLHHLGIVDFAFAKPKLLLTGILVLVTFFLFASPIFFLLSRVSGGQGTSEQRQPSHKEILLLVAISLSALIAASAVSCFGDDPRMGQLTVWKLWGLWHIREKSCGLRFFLQAVATLAIALTVYFPCVMAAGSLCAARKLAGSAVTLKHFYSAVAIAVAVISTIGYICIFTLTFYSAVPQEFGGGKPYYESFAVTEDGSCQLQQLGIPFSQKNITKPLPVLHETDTLVAVWLNPPTGSRSWPFVVAELDKKQINAMTVDDTPERVVPPKFDLQSCQGESDVNGKCTCGGSR